MLFDYDYGESICVFGNSSSYVFFDKGAFINDVFRLENGGLIIHNVLRIYREMKKKMPKKLDKEGWSQKSENTKGMTSLMNRQNHIAKNGVIIKVYCNTS